MCTNPSIAHDIVHYNGAIFILTYFIYSVNTFICYNGRYMNTVRRLYETFAPEHYNLTLDISQRLKRRFSGQVAISGTSHHERAITLHAKDIEVTKAWFGDTPLTVQHEGDEVTLQGVIPVGTPIELQIDFMGKITDAMHGLYPCYFDVDGDKKELLATQFESHHAREVFPCVDEPEAKATFALTLITEPDITVLSNMPVASQAPNMTAGNSWVTSFLVTPRMSTYLLAFVAGELHKQTATTKSGVEVNVWATEAQPVESLAFPLEVAVGSIDFFDDYFGTPYPLPKADHVALPDFSSGAMENWGLITYREIALLVDQSSSVSMREYVATVIAHETSHQWFGNLVTMKWWDDLWLNESFATIMEYVAVDALYPEWKTWNTFASQETLSALRRDQLAGVQAVKCAVNHPDEISTLFDPSIVYAKGGRLLKMLRSYIGEEAFRNGLRDYFQKHAYQNTVGADLWKAFSASSGKDIEAFMKTWISQSGLPLVSLHTTQTGYELTQERFVVGGEADERLWPIPLFSTHPEFPELFDNKNIVFSADHTAPLLNVDNDAHFVTHYDEEARELLRKALEDGQLSEIARLSLLHETSLLARAGKTETSALIPLVDSYRHEDKEPVWNIISMVIGDLKRFTEEDEVSERHLKHRVTALAQSLYDTLGFTERDGEPEHDTKLRALILGLLVYGEHDDVITRSLEAFRASDDLMSLSSETRAVVFTVAARHGTDEDFNTLLAAHQATANAELRDDITSGLCSTRETPHITQLLSQLTEATIVKRQDLFRWFIYLLRNRYARQATWQWMVDNWSWIEKNFEGDKSYDDFARYSASVFATEAWLDTYRTFFEPKMGKTALRRAIEIGLVEIESRAQWLARDGDAVRTRLAQETA